MESLEKKIFGVFIRALWSETDETQYTFLSEFFKQFDLKIDSDYVKNWIDGKNQSYKKKFRSVNCTQDNYKNAFEYLEKTINIRFKNVQSNLKAYSGEYLYIDFDTDDREVFFNSLLNQFMEIVGLPLSSTVVPFVRDEDISEKQEKVPLDETPSEQMSRIFGQAVADHNIAVHVCALKHHLNAGAICPEDIPAFFDTVKNKILSKFVNHQDEVLFQKIIEFSEELKNYFGFLGMLPAGCDLDINTELESKAPLPFWAEPNYRTKFITEPETESKLKLMDLSSCWEINQSYDEVFSLIAFERSRLREKYEKDNCPSSVEDELIRLDFLSSIFTAHKRICELFAEISGGQTLQIFW